MRLTERLANLSIPTVIITIVVLLILRYVLLRQRTPIAKSIAEVFESLAVAMGLVFLIIRPFLVQAFFIPSASMHPTLLEEDHIIVNKLVYRLHEPKPGDIVVFKAPMEANPPGDTTEKDFIKRVIAAPGDVVRITAGCVYVDDARFSHRDLESALQGYIGSNDDGKVKLVKNQVLVDGKLVSNSQVADAVGMPGGKVKVVPGTVYINDKPLKEPFTAEDPDDPYPGGPRDYVKPEWLVTVQGKQAVKVPKGRLLVMGDNRNDSNDARFWGLLDRNRVLGKAMFIFWPINRIRWVR